jgi:hypothetical protein
MNKHTPGPWTVGPSCNEIINVDHGYLPFSIAAGYTLIGALYEDGDDARLIAAAPELLVAIKSLLSCIDPQDFPDEVAFADAAIAKATGETK